MARRRLRSGSKDSFSLLSASVPSSGRVTHPEGWYSTDSPHSSCNQTVGAAGPFAGQPTPGHSAPICSGLPPSLLVPDSIPFLHPVIGQDIRDSRPSVEKSWSLNRPPQLAAGRAGLDDPALLYSPPLKGICAALSYRPYQRRSSGSFSPLFLLPAACIFLLFHLY